MNGELPEGWSLARISDVTEPVANFNPEVEPGRMFSYVDISSIDNATFTIAGLKQFKGKDAPSRARRPIRANDILFSNVRTYLRNVALVAAATKADLCSTGFTVLRANGAVLPQYLFRYVLSEDFIDRVTPQQTGTHYPATSDRVVMGETIPLPPMAEQRRIVAKIETLIPKVAASRQRLDGVKDVLERFRQAVLAAASDGRLTADWRTRHPKLEAAVPNPPASRRRDGRRGANLSGPTELLIENLPDIPPSWQYVRHDWLAAPGTVICYGIVLPGPEIPRGVPYVRQQDIQDGRITIDELRHTTKMIAVRHGRSSLAEEDVLLCIIRNLRVAIVPKELEGANITQGSVRIRPDKRYVSSHYLAAYLASPGAQAWMRSRYFGMDMPRINVEDARALPIALPPIEEQQEIVRRLERLLGIADGIKARLGGASQAVEHLTQSLLGKAFRGELVPTEAALAKRQGRTYEPASAMLERVRTERTRTAGARRVPPQSRVRLASEIAAKSHSARVVRRRTA
jgi:type I restriction enzyme, S subunit